MSARGVASDENGPPGVVQDNSPAGGGKSLSKDLEAGQFVSGLA